MIKNRASHLLLIASIILGTTITYAADIMIDTHKDLEQTLICCAQSGNLKHLQKILETDTLDINARDDEGRSALINAASGGHVECVHELLKKPTIEVNLQDLCGDTALMHAAQMGNRSCVLRLLHDTKIAVNHQDRGGHTALIFAADEGLLDCLELLLKHKDIDPNVQNKSGHTALTYSALWGHTGCLKALLDHQKTDINIQDTHGCTALMHSAERGTIKHAKPLLDKKDLNTDTRDKQGYTALMILADKERSLNPSDKKKNKATQILLALCAIDINAGKGQPKPTYMSLDPLERLHTAARAGNITTVRSLCTLYPSIINAKDRLGWTALCHAAAMGHGTIIQALTQRGAYTDIVTESGYTPHRIARYFGHEHCARVLHP